MRLFTAIFLLSILSCNNSDADSLSFWEKQKSNFKYSKKTEFVINDTLLQDLTNLKKTYLHFLPWVDTVYLYSWQGSDKSKNEFTVVAHEGKYGLSIFYIITNKSDSLISSTRIAGIDDSGNRWYNFKTVFATKDTFFISGVLHVIEPNGEISVILKDYSDSTKRAK